MDGLEATANVVAGIYAIVARRQEPLGEEFSDAIFDDLDSLYES